MGISFGKSIESKWERGRGEVPAQIGHEGLVTDMHLSMCVGSRKPNTHPLGRSRVPGGLRGRGNLPSPSRGGGPGHEPDSQKVGS